MDIFFKSNLASSETLEMITKFTEHSDRVVSVAFSPDNYLIASASYDETVRIWNPKTGKQLHIFSVKPTIGAYEDEYKFTIDSSSKVAFSSEGQALSIVNGYNTIATFEINSGKIFKKSYGRASYGGATALDVNSELFASALPWGGVELWDLKEGKRITTFPKTGLIGAIAISPDKQFLIVYDIISYNIQVWNIETKKLEHIFPNCLDNRAIAISSSRKLVAAGCHGEIKLWSLDTGEEIGTLTGHSSYINTLIFSSDGKTLASGSSDETIKLWEIATGKEVHNLSSPGLYSIAISPNGKFLASAGFDSTVRVWKMP